MGNLVIEKYSIGNLVIEKLSIKKLSYWEIN